MHVSDHSVLPAAGRNATWFPFLCWDDFRYMKIKIISFIAGAIAIVLFMVLKNAISIKLGNRIDVPEIKLTLTYAGKDFYWCLRNNSANAVILDKRALHLSRIIQCRLIATGDYIGPSIHTQSLTMKRYGFW